MNCLSRFALFVAGAVALTAFPSCSSSEPPQMDPEEMMAQWEAMNAPGEHQEHLQQFVGTFAVKNTMWMAPGAEPVVSSGLATNRMILEGRYLEGEYQGEMEGRPFTGWGLTGYDNMAQKYVNVWADSMSTGVMLSEGHCDKNGKVFTYGGEMDMGPMGKQTYRIVLTILDKDMHKFEWFDLTTGEEVKTMEMVYTRKQ